MILQTTKDLIKIPRRIVSLVPSQTELLFFLGLDKSTIAITKFCCHPPGWQRTKKIIGGTKDLKTAEIIRLAPDLIIANKEENVKEQIEILADSFPVWLTDVHNLTSAVSMIKDIGQLTGKIVESASLTNKIEQAFHSVKPGKKIKTAYLIWKKPYMAVGGDTFINDMMCRCGFQNIFESIKRYPEVTSNDLKEHDCQLLLLSSEPYPFKQKHIAELQSQLPGVKIMLVDGEMFSWYGSRLLAAADYFKQLVVAI